jgi:hypothetical protein
MVVTNSPEMAFWLQPYLESTLGAENLGENREF